MKTVLTKSLEEEDDENENENKRQLARKKNDP